MLKRSFIAFLTGVSVAAGQGSILIDSHSDVSFGFNPTTTGWTNEVIYGSFENPENQAAFDEVVFPLRDQPINAGGERYTIPSGFDFLGAPEGSPIWIAPQANRGYTWPGFRNSTPVGALASYTPNDPRVSSQGAQPWIKIDLVDVDYLGLGLNPQVSLWQSNDFGDTIVWAATSDGLDSSDAYYQLANGHSHLNWGFTEKGVFQLNLQANAYEGPGMTNPTQSDVGGVIFAVGTFAIWKAEYYSGDDLLDEAVTGAMTDGDFDGVPLLLEYAFNLSPTTPDVHHVTPVTGLSGLPTTHVNNDGQLQIEYVRRKQSTEPDIEYEAQFASGLDSEDWQTATDEDVNSIDDEWERVVVTDAVVDAERRFARVSITQQP